jgi:PleD family two-component response regulator
MAERERPFRVLLVEPDDGAASALMPLLEGHGVAVDRIREGLRAFVRIQDEPYDAVWISWHGIDVGAAALCAMIRSHEQRRADVPRFLLILGRESDREEIVAQSEDADDFLVGEWTSREVAWKLRLAREMMSLRRSARRLGTDAGMLTAQGLREFLGEEVNRLGRRGGWLSVAVLGLPALAGLRVSYGEAWTAWFESGIWASVRNRLRNYDRMGTLEGGAVCLVAPDLDLAGMSGLVERLSRMVAEYSVAENTHAQALALAVRSLSVRVRGSYPQFATIADSIWRWVEEQARQPLSEGVLAFVGEADPLVRASLALDGL